MTDIRWVKREGFYVLQYCNAAGDWWDVPLTHFPSEGDDKQTLSVAAFAAIPTLATNIIETPEVSDG